MDKNQMIYDFAYGYLCEKMDKEELDKTIIKWKESRPENIQELCKKMINHVQNKQRWKNVIGEIENLRGVFFDFEPRKINESYKNNWEKLFEDIKIKANPRHTKKMRKDSSHGIWVIFCKAILSIAVFLLKFEQIDEFRNYVKLFYDNEETRLALPLLLGEEIFGFKFALACDFLKENGYPEYVKPDVHIKEIFRSLELTSGGSDFHVCKNVIEFSRSINKVPYEVDKLFVLIGMKSSKKELKKFINECRKQMVQVK